MCTCHAHGVGPMTSPRTAILCDVRVLGPACRSVNTLDLTLTGSSNGANVHTSQCARDTASPRVRSIIVRQGVRETLDFPGVQRHSPRVRDSRVRVTGRCDCACPCGATTWRCPRGCRRRGPMPRTHLPDRMFSTRYTATHASADASAPVQPLRARLSGNFSGPSRLDAGASALQVVVSHMLPRGRACTTPRNGAPETARLSLWITTTQPVHSQTPVTRAPPAASSWMNSSISDEPLKPLAHSTYECREVVACVQRVDEPG